jgi:SAM-dependent methyltransferase
VTLWEAWESRAEAWVEWARRPGLDGFWEGTWPELVSVLRDHPGLIVEIGCGEGRVGRQLQDLGHRVVGLERSPTLARAAAHHTAPIVVVQADAARVPLRDGCADTAVACMSLLDVDDLVSTVDEIGRVVRAGGHLCVALVHPFASAQDAETMHREHSVVSQSYLAERRTEDHMEREGLAMTFSSMHRPLSRYLSAFFAAGFVVDALREFGAHPIPWLLTLRLLHLGIALPPARP